MKIHKQATAIAVLALILFAGVIATFAQTAPQERTPERVERNAVIPRDRVEVYRDFESAIRLIHEAGIAGGDNTFVFLSSEMSFDGRVVRGAPYSAEAVTETTRTLGDGNRIVHRTNALVYRDSEGRTRRDQTLGTIGDAAASGEPVQTSFINDPVAGVNYILDPRTNTARRLPLLRFARRPAPANGQTEVSPSTAPTPPTPPMHIELAPPVGGMQMRTRHRSAQAATESLGRQTIEGIEAVGTRSTITIPAGEMGNERPIQIVSESWYSPELQTVVMTRRNDPLTGEVVYRLTNINRTEPARTLFEIPANYTVRDVPRPSVRR